MAGQIPTSFIDDLLGRIDIVEVIDQRVPLRKQGSDWVACCPFHDEKTPSFTVTPSKQLYYCFGCGAGGSALGFVMAYDNLGFVEAVEALAESIGLDVPREGGGEPRSDDLGPLRDALAAAERFYRNQLRHCEEAITYLKRRGVSGETAARYGLGYAPVGWSTLIDCGITHDAATLHRAGLVNRHEGTGRYYDRLRGRIVFPIRDRRGRTVAFGGRALGDETPKYLNTPESPVFHKSRELYGLYEARRARRGLASLLVVEGYMDVVRLAEHGIDYAVATLGTAATQQHVQRLFRTVADVVFCFDGDEAGLHAAWRALQNTLPVLTDGREARFLFLPQGEDPDSLIGTEGAGGFEQRIRQAMPLADFLLQRLRDGINTSTIGGRVQVAERARPLLESMPTGLYYDLLIDRVATAVGTSSDRLRGDLGGAGPTPSESDEVERPSSGGAPLRMTPMRTAIALILQNPDLAAQIPSDHPAIAGKLNGGRLLGELRGHALSDRQVSSARLLEAFRGTPEYHHLERLATHGFATDDTVDRRQALQQELSDALERLGQSARRARRNELIEAADYRQLTPDEKEELRSLMDAGSGQKDA